MFDSSLNATLDLNEVSRLDDVILRMQKLIKLLEADRHTTGYIPFTRTYLQVTKAVASHQDDFEDFAGMERLDVVFANEYFLKLRLYINGSIHNPWRTFFNYTSTETYVPFVAMLLGINAHINGDLAVSLYKAKYKSKKDFKKINAVLHEVTPIIMKDLFEKDHDLLGLAAEVFMPFVESELDKIIVSWRENAWDIYQKLQKMNWLRRRGYQEKIYAQTELIGKDIIDIFQVDSFEDGRQLLNRLHKLALPSL